MPAESLLAGHPEDTKALRKWRQGYIVIYILAEAVALYGVVLHFIGFAAVRVGPFFVAGFTLILFFRPAVLPSSRVSAG